MSFFFRHETVIATQWFIKEAEDDTSEDCVVIGHEIWSALVEDTSSSRVCVSLTFKDQELSSSQLPSTCWAIRSDKSLHNAIEIPLPCLKYHKSTGVNQLSGKVFIRLASPPTLTTVVVIALSDEAYSGACHGTLLDNLLYQEQRILTEGEVLEADLGDNATQKEDKSLRYRLEMLEPMSQGYADRQATRVLLIASDEHSSTLVSDDDFSNESAQENEDEEYIEISEDFLAQSVLCQDLAHSTISPVDGLSGYTCRKLLAPVNAVEDSYTLYLRTTNLGKIGVQSGDWAIVGTEPSRLRLVRIVANDAVTDWNDSVAGSPLLIYNTFGDEAKSFSSTPSPIHINPSPFGSATPAIPTAQSITIARVASPASTNRQYQPLFISSLKAFFETGRQLVKQGDILAVTIDTDSSRVVSEHEDEFFGNTINPSRANEVVFFKVTNIEHNVVGSSRNQGQDLYAGSTMGELGCWVDASMTRMIQTGVEHCRVPSVKSYLNIDSLSAKSLAQLNGTEDSHLTGPKCPYAEILSLSSAAFSQRAVDYHLDLSFLLKGGRGIGKYTVASWVAESLGLHLLEVNCYDIIGENDTKTEATLRVRLEQAQDCAPCLLVLRNLEGLCQTTQATEPGKEFVIANVLRECLEGIQAGWRLTGYPVIVMGTIRDSSRVPANLLGCFKHEIAFEAPNEGERLEILKCLLCDEHVASDVSLQDLATQTAALLAGDLSDLVMRARAAAVERATATLSYASASSAPALTAADFEVALSKARDSYSESIGAPKIPTVSWDDVGGLAHVKTDILDTIQLPLEHPELFADGLKKRSGILLYGPPGTGKTLIAKAVATSCSLNFFSVKGPELLNMYIGESEANVRRVFQRARDAKPCVIFFDELDSVAPKRGNHGDSGGVMDRIVSQLLAELDGMSGGSSGADVFVIGATNRPDLLDPALLRPGRFDRMLYLGVSDTHEAQLNILDALTRKFRLDASLNLRSIAEKCPFNYTGADFYALCSDAMLNAMSRKAESIEDKIALLNSQQGPYSHPHPITPQYYLAEMATPEEILVYVSEKDFEMALEALVPSVSQAEMEHYAEVQRRFSQPTQEDEQVEEEEENW
ncbi:AAA-domain-containing protein [Agrocybe pediades]|nr:AAA-domain-containing protein [Agrocybe pediades]